MLKKSFLIPLLFINCLLPPEKPIPISGPWHFQVDRERAGIDGKWFAADIDISFMSEVDLPGFWESYGYHNHGDPWREERYSR